MEQNNTINNDLEQEEEQEMEQNTPEAPATLTWFSTASLTNTTTYRGSTFGESSKSTTPCDTPRSATSLPTGSMSPAERARKLRNGFEECPRCAKLTPKLENHLLVRCKSCPHEGCEMVFEKRKYRESHKVNCKHSPDRPDRPDRPTFQCQDCPKVYVVQGAFKNHCAKKHPAENPTT